MNNKSSKGFTLIELVVVIGIIGILAGMIMLVLNPALRLQKARDGQRKADLLQIQSALEIYRADIGEYPSTLLNCTTYFGSPAYSGNTACTNTYLKKIPTDPKGSAYYNSGNYYYIYGNNETTYTLVACLENVNDSQGINSSVGSDSSCTTGRYYEVNNP